MATASIFARGEFFVHVAARDAQRGLARTHSLLHTCCCESARSSQGPLHIGAATAGRLQDSTLHDLDAGDGAVARVGLLALDLADDLHGRLVEHLAENNVLAVEPGRRDGRDEEPAGALRLRGLLPRSALAALRTRSWANGTHWEPLVFGPALAMESWPGLVCLNLKFSSANFSPESGGRLHQHLRVQLSRVDPAASQQLGIDANRRSTCRHGRHRT